MPKFKFFIVLISLLTLGRGWSSYSAQVTLVNQGLLNHVNVADVLNQALPLAMFWLVLLVLYFLISGMKSLRTKAKPKTLPWLPTNEASKHFDTAVKSSASDRNVIGWYLFNSVVIGASFGGIGFVVANYTFGFNNMASEIVGWAAGITLGIICFNKKWELF